MQHNCDFFFFFFEKNRILGTAYSDCFFSSKFWLSSHRTSSAHHTHTVFAWIRTWLPNCLLNKKSLGPGVVAVWPKPSSFRVHNMNVAHASLSLVLFDPALPEITTKSIHHATRRRQRPSRSASDPSSAFFFCGLRLSVGFHTSRGGVCVREREIEWRCGILVATTSNRDIGAFSFTQHFQCIVIMSFSCDMVDLANQHTVHACIHHDSLRT